MSLQVWLPLNGDLHNQGLSGLTVTNNGATVNDSGKIGKCYSFNGSSNLITLDSCPFSQKSQWSICAWLYPNTNSLVGFFGCRGNSSNSSLYQLSIAYSTGSDAGYSLMYRDNNTSSPAKFTFASSITASIWQHWVFTYNNGLFSAYKDGILLNTYQSTGSTMNLINSDISIGCNRAGSPQGYFNGCINDFRIYDHALSPKEVEEIAKGLVLHYKLDDPYSEGTTNLWKVADYSSTPQTIVPYKADVTDTYINHNLSSNINPYGANKVTISMDITNNTDTNIYFRARTKDTSNSWLSWASTQSTAFAPPGKTTRVYQTFDWSSGTDGSSIYLRYYLGKQRGQCASTDNFIISHLQVETKDHPTPWVKEATTRTPTTIFDSSGYSHNGTIVGTLTAAAGSPRYEIATQFPGNTSSYIQMPTISLDWSKVSFSAWGKWHAFNSWSRIFDFGNAANGADWDICLANHSTNSNVGLGGRTGNGASFPDTRITEQTLTADTWYHLVETIDAKSCKLYINGTLVKTITLTNTPTFITMTLNYLGKSNWSSNGAFNGSISDFRLYATVLTADQIKELYTTSMSVDSSGNIHARELSEL